VDQSRTYDRQQFYHWFMKIRTVEKAGPDRQAETNPDIEE